MGDVLGFVGSSGTDSATNFHLHFEVRPNNVPVNPLPLIDVPAGVDSLPDPLHPASACRCSDRPPHRLAPGFGQRSSWARMIVSRANGSS